MPKKYKKNYESPDPIVEAGFLKEDNLDRVAEWCGGQLGTIGGDEVCVNVPQYIYASTVTDDAIVSWDDMMVGIVSWEDVLLDTIEPERINSWAPACVGQYLVKANGVFSIWDAKDFHETFTLIEE